MLRQELKDNPRWTKESIKQFRATHEKDLFITEEQIYKWMWDQTKRREKEKDEVCDDLCQLLDIDVDLLVFQCV